MNSPIGYTWGSIALMVTCSTVGDVMLSKTMKTVGDLSVLSKRSSLPRAIGRIARTSTLWIGLFFMAITFYTLLFALSHADVSLVVPAATSLTFPRRVLSPKSKFRLTRSIPAPASPPAPRSTSL